MAGNVNIVYDPSIENEESLNRFKEVLIKANYDSALIKFVSLEDYSVLLKDKVPSYTICINQTYKIISTEFESILGVPSFEFSSKIFSDKTDNILLYGILLDVNEIFQDSYKHYVWSTVNSFYKKYKTFLAHHNIETEETPVSLVEKEVVQEEVNVTIQVEGPPTPNMETAVDVGIESKVNITTLDELSPKSILSFAKSVQTLLISFAEVRDQLDTLLPRLEKENIL